MRRLSIELRRVAVVSLLACGWPLAARAQCCLGAQDVEATSFNGRYRVQATSLSGTGPSNHGPYHYRYRWLARVDDGNYIETSAFEVEYDCDEHFSMRILVSPTGNGFLLTTSLSQTQVFFSPAGSPLASRPGQAWISADDTTNGVCYEFLVSADEGAVLLGTFLLPFGSFSDERLEYGLVRLLSSEEDPTVRSSKIADLLKELDHDEFEVRENASRALLEEGPFSVAPLEAFLAGPTSSEAEGRARAILEELAPWKVVGGVAARQDLILLAGLADQDRAGREGWFQVQDRARMRFLAIVPQEARSVLEREEGPSFSAWVEENLDRLTWDESLGRYRFEP